MMRSRWRQDIRLEMMREAAGRICRRCGAPALDDEGVCDKCQWLDWHEDLPEVCVEEAPVD
jgi:ribosomal protein L40E